MSLNCEQWTLRGNDRGPSWQVHKTSHAVIRVLLSALITQPIHIADTGKRDGKLLDENVLIHENDTWNKAPIPISDFHQGVA